MRRRLKIEPALWPWWDGDMPRVVHLAAAQRSRLADLVAALPPVDLGIIEQVLILLSLVQAAKAAAEEHHSE